MIQSESRMRENRTSGLTSGRRKRNHGSRTEAHRESGGYATGPYSWRASRRLYELKNDRNFELRTSTKGVFCQSLIRL